MQRMKDILGKELGVDAVNRTLRDFVRSHRPPVVGAVHVTCSDETEREIADSFQQWFCDTLLPELKSWSRASFRTANLGGRYEWGAVRIAEEHYALAQTADDFKMVVVKINSHVAVRKTDIETTYGQLNRYGMPSACCGALHALMDGTRHPAMDELRETFCFDGSDRLAALLDPATVDPPLRGFLAAVVNARLQARSAIVDIQDYTPHTPTVFLVLPTVTLNRPQRDTEFVVGLYWSDSRKGVGKAHYVGLGDDPSRYAVRQRHGLEMDDDQLQHPRPARDHRQEIVQQWRARHPQPEPIRDPRLDQIANRLRQTSDYSTTMAQETLKTLLWTMAEVSPIPLTILLFAKGVAGAHHLYHVHRLARGVQDEQRARAIIDETTDRITNLPTDQAVGTVRAILSHYQPAGAEADAMPAEILDPPDSDA